MTIVMVPTSLRPAPPLSVTRIGERIRRAGSQQAGLEIAIFPGTLTENKPNGAVLSSTTNVNVSFASGSVAVMLPTACPAVALAGTLNVCSFNVGASFTF